MTGLLPAAAAERANLGVALRRAGKLDEAAGAYRQALGLAPDHAPLHNNLGSALHEAGRTEAAAECYRKAIVLAPDQIAAYHNLGSLLRDSGRLAEAEACFLPALLLAPHSPDLQGGRASLSLYQGRLDRAIAGWRAMIALQPERADAYINLAGARCQQGSLALAEQAYRLALTLAPDHGEARFNLSLLLLLTGRFAEGWPGYEERWKTRQLAKERRSFSQPQWRGEEAAGKTILLHAEQGFGDALQFCRYAPLVKARGLRVLLEVQPPLHRLLASLEGCDRVVARGDALPPFDLHSPLMSLPLALGMKSLGDIPASIPYIRTEKRYSLPASGRKVGVAWAGAPRADSPEQAAFDRRRSLPDAALAQLLAVPDVQFVSLQKGRPASIGMIDLMAGMADFADTAALIAELDLVISVDTAIAHLAGAMGKPVWLLNRFDTDWRWLTDRPDTPWYPTMRIFRQCSPGDWAGLIDDVVDALSRNRASGLKPLQKNRD